MPCSRGASTIFSISPITLLGIQRFAIGTNHAPVAQPCDHCREPVHFLWDAACALLLHTIRSTNTTIQIVMNSDVVAFNVSSWVKLSISMVAAGLSNSSEHADAADTKSPQSCDGRTHTACPQSLSMANESARFTQQHARPFLHIALLTNHITSK
jgi:hypothetical protein